MAPRKNTNGGRKSSGRKIIQPDNESVFIAEHIVAQDVKKIRGVMRTVYHVKFVGHPLNPADWLTASNIGNYHLDVWNGVADPEDDDDEEDGSGDEDSEEDDEDSELSDLDSKQFASESAEENEDSELSDLDSEQFASDLDKGGAAPTDTDLTDSAVAFDDDGADGADEPEGTAGEPLVGDDNDDTINETQKGIKDQTDETVYEADDEMDVDDDDMMDAEGEIDEDPDYELTHPPALESNYINQSGPAQGLQGLLEQDLEMHGGGTVNSKWRED